MTYGLSPQASVSARDVQLDPSGASYTATCAAPKRWARVTLSAWPGPHNVVNSLAAVAVGLDLGVPFERIREG